MENILFINSCIRNDDVSRTYLLCKAFIEKYKSTHSDVTVTEIKLSALDLRSYLENDIEERDKALFIGDSENGIFSLSKQFASADKILIGAPLWDFSLPSVLKVYIEHICVNGITFHYTEQGPEGLSAFSKLFYITTAGGYIGSHNCGVDYIKTISEFLGCGNFESLSIEGLDIIGNDAEAIMQDGIRKAEELAERF